MPETTLKVKLLAMTPNALEVMYSACRQCYSDKFAGDMFDEALSKPQEAKKKEDFVRRVAASGHESPLEHVSFTFAIEGISRAATHQLVRHRVASYSQQSQRYVKESDFDYVIPPSIKKDPELLKLFEDSMHNAQKAYTKLIDAFAKKGVEGEKANQDARFILPNACETKIVATMNARELIHFFKVRCCSRTQWELYKVAHQMLKIAQEKLPAVFGEAGAKCDFLKYCPEGEKFTCGRYPVKEKVLTTASS